MKILTSNPSTLTDLKDYPFESRYMHISHQGHELKIDYLYEDVLDQPILLMLHGNGTWTYMFRKLIPILTQNKFRVIAPDLIGFGKSDKFKEVSMFSYHNL